MKGSTSRSRGPWRGLAVASIIIVAVLLAALYLTRPVLEQWVAKQIEATLAAALVPDVSVEGPARWRLWPKPGFMLDGVTITDDGRTLVRNERLEVEIDVEALRSRSLVVERIVLERPEIMLGDEPARWLSADAWLVPNQGAGGAALPSVRRVLVRDGRLSVDGPNPVSVAGVDIELEMPDGGLRPGHFVFDADLQAMVQGVSVAGRLSQLGRVEVAVEGLMLREASLRFEGQAEDFDLVDLALTLGELAAAGHETRVRDLSLALQVQGNEQALNLSSSLAELAFEADGLKLSGLTGEIAVEVEPTRAELEFSVRQLRAKASNDVDAELGIAWTLTGPFDVVGEFAGVAAYSIDAEGADHVHGQGRLGIRLPARKVGAEDIDLDLQTLAAWWPRLHRAQGAVTGRLDDSELAGTWRFDRHAARPLHVELEIERLDLDDYLGEAETHGPPDLAPWRAWPLSAELLIRQLRWRGLETTDTRLAINPD